MPPARRGCAQAIHRWMTGLGRVARVWIAARVLAVVANLTGYQT
jgi:hypothetical protein